MMKITGFFGLAVLCLASTAWTGTNPESELALNDMERVWLATNHSISIGNETDWPPFDFDENNKAQGYAIDLIQLVADKVGLSVNYVTGPRWAQLLDDTRSGKIDVLPAIYASDERREYLSFSASYYSQPSVIVVKTTDDSISDFNSLSGKRVAGVRGFAFTDTLASKHPEIQLVVYESVTDCLKAVSIGKVDAYIDSIGLVAYSLDNNFIPNLRVIGNINQPGFINPPLHFAVNKNNPLLLSILNKGLAAVTDQDRQQLANKWLSLNSYEQRQILTAEQTQWIRRHPVVRVGLDPAYPPYSFLDQKGDYAGIAVDYLKLISDKTSIQFKPATSLQWPELLDGLRNKTLDMVAPVVQTQQRNEYMIFSPSFITAPLVIMTRSNNNSIRSAADLAGQRVALVKGYSSSDQVLHQDSHLIPHWVNSPADALHALSSGNVDAYVGVLGVNIFLIQQQGISNLQIAATYQSEFDGQRFAFRSDWPQLAVLVTKALDDISAEQRSVIHNRWINVPDERPFDYRLIWRTLAICALILLIMYTYNRRLSREIEQRKRIENKLSLSNKKLEQEKCRADTANHSKSQFVSNVSHELKTPLNAVIGFSDILRLDNTLNTEQRERADLIFDAGNHLNRLIDDLLDLSRIEAGKMEFELQPVTLNRSVEECLLLTQLPAQQRGIEIINCLRADDCVLADPTRLKQVLLNLLSNAIKYNEKEGSITLHSECKDGFVQLFIDDTGIGLDQRQLEQLFVFFERVGAERTDTQGTGIGLALSKTLIEAMGGTMGVSSRKGTGSQFWFILPTASHHQQAASMPL